MNTQNPPIILEEGKLPKNDEPYFIRELTSTFADLDESDRLQSDILSLLGPNQTLIHPQSRDRFIQRCNGEHAITLGVFVHYPNQKNPRLIAQQTMRLSADPDIPLLMGLDPARIGCAEGFMVHPDYRGNNLTDKLLHHMHQIGKQKYNKQGFMSCADASNPFSYNVLMKNGYGITHAYVDAADNGKTYAFLRCDTAKVYPLPPVEKIESGHFEDIQDDLQKAKKPAIIYGKPVKICTHQGILNRVAEQRREAVNA